MVLNMENKSLKPIREVLFNEVNEVYVCEDTTAKHSVYHTLWKVKEHRLAKELLEVLNQIPDLSICKGYFAGKDFMGFLFPFEKERPLFRFYSGKIRRITEREEIQIGLVKACMIQEIPYPVLYMLLEQKQIHLQRDNSVCFSYFVDLRDFDVNKKQKDCVNLCAMLLLELMQEESVKGSLSYSIILQKLQKNGYSEFTQLFRDLKLSASNFGKKNIIRKIGDRLYSGKDFIFRGLLVLSIMMVGMVFIMIISQMIFGEIPIFRIFQNCFEKIGTQSLLQ